MKTDPETVSLDELRAIRDATMTEKELQSSVIALAHLWNWLVYHTYDSRGSAAGFPDLVMAKDGRVIFAELKTMKGKYRPEQVEWADQLSVADSRTNGGTLRYFLWRPCDLSSGAIEAALR